MKKLLVVFAAMLVMCTNGFAESIDLSGLSLTELIDLRTQVQLAMWETEDWQEVEVPQGLYQIGVDIPAKHWNIKAADGLDPAISYGDTLSPSGMDIEYSRGIWYMEILSGQGGWRESSFPNQYPNSVNIQLQEGTYFLVENGSVIFTPYSGAHDLGFK